MKRKDYLHLKEDMQQKWHRFTDEIFDYYFDQYGFFIHVLDSGFVVKWKGKKCAETKTLEAAKLISNILINERL